MNYCDHGLGEYIARIDPDNCKYGVPKQGDHIKYGNTIYTVVSVAWEINGVLEKLTPTMIVVA